MSPSSPPTSLTLLDELRSPNAPAVYQLAWERFVSLYTPIFCHWARRWGLQDADAQDVTQQVLETVRHELPTYTRGPEQKFGGWLYILTKNKCYDFNRRVATRHLPGSDGLSGVADDPPSAEFEAREELAYQRDLIRRGLDAIRDNFDEQKWKAFELVVIDGKTAADAAAELGVSESTVYRARDEVVKRLKEEVGEFLK